MAEPPIARALISVSDKTGLVELARFLQRSGVEILSTGGTAKTLREAGIAVHRRGRGHRFSGDHGRPGQDPASQDPWRHPGAPRSARSRAAHEDRMASARSISWWSISIPSRRRWRRAPSREDCIENIDIGGPAMIRAAAKNHDFVTIVTDPADYACGHQTSMTANKGATTLALRRRLRRRRLSPTPPAYDAAISQWMAAQEDETFPKSHRLRRRAQAAAALWREPASGGGVLCGQEPGRPRAGIATATQLQGKELSYNNLNDTDAAYELAAEFDAPACAIIKHANPCGVAVAGDLVTAFKRALACDPVSAFGGIIAVNRAARLATAKPSASCSSR